jgi:hypothetical protein
MAIFSDVSRRWRRDAAPVPPFNFQDAFVNSFRPVALLGALVLLLPIGLAAQTATPRSPAPARQTTLPRNYSAKPTTAAISAGDLMSRLYVFADDSMQGREAGTRGQLKGTVYIAKELKRLGLQPAGDGSSFFQNVPFISRTLSRTTTLIVNNGMYNAFADFVALPFRGAAARPLNEVDAVYGGVVGDTAHAITAAQAAGKLVILTAPNGMGRIPPNSPLQQAAGVAIVGEELLTPQQVAQGKAASMTLKPAPDAPAVPVTLIVTSTMATALLGGPVGSQPVGTVGRKVVGNLTYDEAPAPTRNVVAVLPGVDANLKGQYVAIGAHSDHIGYRAAGAVDHDSLHLFNARRYFITDNPSGAPLTADQRAERDAKIAAIQVNVDSLHRARPARRDSISNGADDDGSGTVTVLEVAEAFAKGKVKPKRSLLFVWHTGEEKGLLGSRYFTDNPTVPRDSIVAQINIDMVGRGAATDLPGGSEKYLQLVGSRRLSTELGDLTETVNKERKVPFTFDYAYDANGHPDNIYCRSDHYNYARYGIPVVFMTTGVHGDYHQVTDEPQYIDYPHMAQIGQFVFALTNRVAGLDHRPVVDKPKPDPTGSCRQ